MKFIDKEVFTIPQYLTESISKQTDNSAHALVLTSITSDIIQVSKFARDIDDEVCVLMFATDTPYYIPLYSREFSAIIYWIGLVNGVKLEVNDINKVIGDLQHYIVVESGNAEFMEETFQSMGVCQ